MHTPDYLFGIEKAKWLPHNEAFMLHGPDISFVWSDWRGKRGWRRRRGERWIECSGDWAVR
jgi:hypothetical protein